MPPFLAHAGRRPPFIIWNLTLLLIIAVVVVAYTPLPPQHRSVKLATTCRLPSPPRFVLQHSKLEDSTDPSTRELRQPCREDMLEFKHLLETVTANADTSPETVLTLLSKKTGWLLSRRVPSLAQLMLDEFPHLRQDNAMKVSFAFLMDFLEITTSAAKAMSSQNQNLLRKLLEAAKVSETALDAIIQSNRTAFTSPSFMQHIQNEINDCVAGSPKEHLLVVVQLRLLEEQGKSLSKEEVAIPKLAAEPNLYELRRKTKEFLLGCDAADRGTFLARLRSFRSEMAAEHPQADPMLVDNLKEMEQVARGLQG